MKHGNWIPISKAFLKDLPIDRAFTKLEASFSLQVDYDNSNEVTLSGCASRWRWSRSKVTSFFNQLGICISYDENTKKKQNQKGQIKRQIKDRYETDNRQIRLIDSSNLKEIKNRKKTDEEQIKDRSKSTTIDPLPNPDPNPELKHMVDTEQAFQLFYKNYPKKKSPDQALKTWLKLSKTKKFPSLQIILSAIENQKQSKEWKKDSGQFIPHPSTWLNNGGWNDEFEIDDPNAQINNKPQPTTYAQQQAEDRRLNALRIIERHTNESCNTEDSIEHDTGSILTIPSSTV